MPKVVRDRDMRIRKPKTEQQLKIIRTRERKNDPLAGGRNRRPEERLRVGNMFEDLDQHDRIRDAFANALARLQKPRREAVRLGNLQGLGIDVGNDGIVARLGQFQGLGPATAADIEDGLSAGFTEQKIYNRPVGFTGQCRRPRNEKCALTLQFSHRPNI